MELPSAEPLTVRKPGPRVVPEPPRRGEPGGEPCGVCTGPEAAQAFGPLVARIERAILDLGDVGRVHVSRWEDGGAHFHVRFMPRPLGMLEATNFMLPLWEDVLPNVTDEELREAAERIAAAL